MSKALQQVERPGTVQVVRAVYEARESLIKKQAAELEQLRKGAPVTAEPQTITVYHDNPEQADTIAMLRAELEELKARKIALPRTGTTSMKVAEKSGGVSVYGLGRYPVTLSKSQWTRLLDIAPEIRMFMELHKHELKTKPEKE